MSWLRHEADDPVYGWTRSLAELQERGVPLPPGLAVVDLRWWQDQILAPGARIRLPSRTELAKRWGWARSRVSRLLEKEAQWSDPIKLDAWRSQRALEDRNGSGTHPERERNELGTIGNAQTPRDDEFRNGSGTNTERERNDPAHRRGESPPPPPPPPPSEEVRSATGSSLPFPPRPVKQPEARAKPPKAPNDRALKLACAETWKALHLERYGLDYALQWPGEDGSRLAALITAFQLRKDLDRGLLRLRSAIGVYFDLVDRRQTWPTGDPPTLRRFQAELPKWTRWGDERLRPRALPDPDAIGPGARIDDPARQSMPLDLTAAELAAIEAEMLGPNGFGDLIHLLPEEQREQLLAESRIEIAWKIKSGAKR